MKSPSKTVISASRRTDIPAFYMDWFMERIQKGYFEVVNPYNRNVSMVSATPDSVHTIVFWSKNFGPFLKAGYGEELRKSGFHLFFNFTVNSESPRLEPCVPPLKVRLEQLEMLARRYGPETIHWRFDPICFFQNGQTPISDNLAEFESIAQKAFLSGIRRCVTSFMDDYPKIHRRIRVLPDFSFIDPTSEKKKEILCRMEKVLANMDITLQTCCENSLVSTLPEDSEIKNGSCIPNDLLIDLFGPGISRRKDSGQRKQKGCGCGISRDVGSYGLHPCYHNCLFCYANPVPPPAGHGMSRRLSGETE